MTRTEVDVANMALRRLGHTIEIPTAGGGTLGEVVTPTRESDAAAFWLPKVLLAQMEDFPWAFARRHVLQTLVDDLTTYGWGDEWSFAYNYPTDCARAWRYVGDKGMWAGGDYTNETWWPITWTTQAGYSFAVRDLAGVQVILSNVEGADAIIEYTANNLPVSRYSELAATAAAWKLAAWDPLESTCRHASLSIL
jgi:hypothetical protein